MGSHCFRNTGVNFHYLLFSFQAKNFSFKLNIYNKLPYVVVKKHKYLTFHLKIKGMQILIIGQVGKKLKLFLDEHSGFIHIT